MENTPRSKERSLSQSSAELSFRHRAAHTSPNVPPRGAEYEAAPVREDRRTVHRLRALRRLPLQRLRCAHAAEQLPLPHGGGRNVPSAGMLP